MPDKAGAGNNLALNMLGAARIWLAQANRSLQRVGPINDVVIDDQANMDAILKATFNKGLVKADLFTFGTWDIVYVTSTRPGNSTLGNLRFALAATK